jgi:hypothetical protein
MGDEMVRFSKSVFLILLILKLNHTAFASQGVVINEVLANEPGSLTRLEWVELFNPDLTEVNLAGWRFASKADTTSLEGVSISANGYIVLVRRLVSGPGDSSSFEGFWGDASGVWGDADKEDFPAVEVSMSLINREGTISLVDPDCNVSSFTWTKDWGDGISCEKIDPAAGDSPDNWTRCSYSEGSTPGGINSVTLAPHDLSVKSADISVEPENPEEFEYFEIRARVRNEGTQRSLPNQLTFFCDYDFNSLLLKDETLAQPRPITPIDVGNHLDFLTEVSFSKGRYRIYAQIDQDDKSYNNSAFIDVKVGTELPDLIINEFMCSPDLSQPEWVEFFNRSDSVVSLRNWSLGDSIEQNLITSEQMEVSPGDYLIVTESLMEFHSVYPAVLCQAVQQEKWAPLNNTGDRVILKDSLNFVTDQVCYTKDWGQGISWERADPERSSSDPDNWWRSVHAAGATPCQKNSLRGGHSEEIELRIEPNPFSPDGDGLEDEVRFEYIIPLKSELTLKIYDVQGRLIKTIFEQQPQTSGEMIWDGKSDKQRIVRAGIYVVFLEAKMEHRKLVKKATVVAAKR